MRQIVIVLILASILVAGCQINQGILSGESTTISACRPLPPDFTEDDLIGTWVAEYFGGLAIDTLTIRADGTYKQVLHSKTRNFEIDGHEWWLEYMPEGYAILHLEGMRRCDDLEIICDEPGGGLPVGELAIDQCRGGYLTYSDEVILFVVGVPHFPRGIELQHARLAGSEWSYGFILEE